jgi:hypothetical protein
MAQRIPKRQATTTKESTKRHINVEANDKKMCASAKIPKIKYNKSVN